VGCQREPIGRGRRSELGFEAAAGVAGEIEGFPGRTGASRRLSRAGQAGGERSGDRRWSARTSRNWERSELAGVPEVPLCLGEILDEGDGLHSAAAIFTAESVEIPYPAQKLGPRQPCGSLGG